MPTLWAYAVGHVDGGADDLPDGWLRYVVPTEDTNRSRWPVHPDWGVIQSAFASELIPESRYEREQREREELLQEVDAELSARPFSESTPKRVQRHKVAASEESSSISAILSAPVVLDLIPIIRKRHYEVNMRRMVAQIAGCTITAEAWRGSVDEETGERIEHDISDTFHFLFQNVEAYLEETERNFEKLVQKKRVLYSLHE